MTDLTWVEMTKTVGVVTDAAAVAAMDDNPGWRLIATGVDMNGEATLTYGWPWRKALVDEAEA